MQLKLSFAALLASVLSVSNLITTDAHSLPPRAGSRIKTLNLKRFSQHSSDVDTYTSFQRRITHAHKRHALMSESSDEELESDVEEGALDKRFNRSGVKRFNSNATGVISANPPTATDSLGLDIEDEDVAYLATIQIGTPPQDFLMLMDSGSADFWVPSDRCHTVQDLNHTGTAGCGKHKTLGYKSSSTFRDTHKFWNITYGSGAAAGTIVQDNIAIAGLQLCDYTFGATTQETVQFTADDVPFDGVVGLARSKLSKQKILTPIEALAKEGLVEEAVVSYKIPRADDNENDGEITFGGLDQTKFDPQTLVTLANVNKKGFWEASVDNLSVDGQDTGLQGRTAILDTGTTLIFTTARDAKAIHKFIAGAQPMEGGLEWRLPCEFNQSVALTFGGGNFTIDPRDIVIDKEMPVKNDTTTGVPFCLSGIVGGIVNVTGKAARQWILGDVFLKNAYFSTNVTGDSISLAKLI